jgi:hypothetical protein
VSARAHFKRSFGFEAGRLGIGRKPADQSGRHARHGKGDDGLSHWGLPFVGGLQGNACQTSRHTRVAPEFNSGWHDRKYVSEVANLPRSGTTGLEGD